MKAIEREFELTTRALLAAEDWAPAFQKAPKQHAELIKNVAKMQRQVMTYFRDVAKDASKFVNWYEYSAAVFEQQRKMGVQSDSLQAYNINVVVNHDQVSNSDQQFIKVVFDTVAASVMAGVESLETEHAMPIGLTTSSAIIQNLTTEQLAHLVGNRLVDKGKPTEHIIPNPNTAYNIDETTRTRIANSVKTSIRLGETHPEALKRMQEVIADTKRAEMISWTETVRAYGEGRAQYARSADASYKVWNMYNAIDECASNADEGPIPIDALFTSGDANEPAHPRCKCLVVYLWADSEDEAKQQWTDY